MASLSPWEHTMIGAFAGMTEVTIMQPTVAIKNALQEGRPLPRTPVAFYRGLAINAGTMFPITAIQFGMNKILEETYINATGHSPGNGAGIAVAMAAGAASAMVSCPAEFVMIQQQRQGRSLGAELKYTLAERGVLGAYKGLSATLMRESLYAAGYLGVVPLLRAKLNTIPSIRDLPGGPMVISGVLSGLLATVSTQPADTIKTRMQAFPDKTANPEYRSLVSTVRHIVTTEGVGTLFAGLLPRATRIVGAVFILTGTRNTAIEILEKRRSVAAALE